MGRDSPEVLAAASGREPILYALALVALGDSVHARRAVHQTLGDLVREGDSLEVQVGRFTRERLAARVLDLAVPGSSRPASGAGDLVELAGASQADDLAAIAAAALATMSVSDRLALALVELDDVVPVDAENLADERHPRHPRPDVEGARTTLLDALSARAAPVSPRSALERLVDLSPWSARPPVLDEVLARRSRARRTRATAGITAAALVGALGWLVVARDGAAPAPSPTQSRVLATRPGSVSIDGVRFTLAVPVARERSLPALPDAVADLALPATLTLPQHPITPLTAGALGDRSVRAVLVRRLPDGTGRALLFVPRGAPELVEVVDVVLPPLADQRPGGSAVGPTTISADRRSVVLADVDGVVIVDTRTAGVTRIPIPSYAGARVGWSVGSDFVIVESAAGQPFRVDPRTGSVEPMGPPGSPSGRWISVTDKPNLLEFDHRGTLVGQRPLPGPVDGVVGETSTSLAGRSATGATFGTHLLPAGATHGLYAVSVDLSPSASALAVRPETDRLGECCAALAWAPRDRVLYLSPGADHWRILAWDVDSGEQFLVSTIDAPPGEWLGEIAL